MAVYSENRPWGGFEKFHEDKPGTVNLIHINAHYRLRLQYHNRRSEFWKIVRGPRWSSRKAGLSSSQRVKPSRSHRRYTGLLRSTKTT